MGAGAIFAGKMAEMAIPTLLIFALVYAGAKATWKVSGGAIRILGLFLLSFVISGAINAFFYRPINEGGYGTFALIAIPLLVSLTVVFFLAPRQKDAATVR